MTELKMCPTCGESRGGKALCACQRGIDSSGGGVVLFVLAILLLGPIAIYVVLTSHWFEIFQAVFGILLIPSILLLLCLTMVGFHKLYHSKYIRIFRQTILRLVFSSLSNSRRRRVIKKHKHTKFDRSSALLLECAFHDSDPSVCQMAAGMISVYMDTSELRQRKNLLIEMIHSQNENIRRSGTFGLLRIDPHRFWGRVRDRGVFEWLAPDLDPIYSLTNEDLLDYQRELRLEYM